MTMSMAVHDNDGRVVAQVNIYDAILDHEHPAIGMALRNLKSQLAQVTSLTQKQRIPK